jgi:hypothetical protein
MTALATAAAVLLTLISLFAAVVLVSAKVNELGSSLD